jgi:hypothetical protein
MQRTKGEGVGHIEELAEYDGITVPDGATRDIFTQPMPCGHASRIDIMVSANNNGGTLRLLMGSSGKVLEATIVLGVIVSGVISNFVHDGIIGSQCNLQFTNDDTEGTGADALILAYTKATN